MADVWTVPATVVRVIDGDTVIVDLDLGWRVYRNAERIRVMGLYCPERNTAAGKAAKAYAESILAPGDRVVVRSSAKPSFERTVGSIEIVEREVGDFRAEMIASGHGSSDPPAK